MIQLAYTYAHQLKPGMKVQILTSEDHKELNTRSQTSNWGSSAEQEFCNKTYTLTQTIIEDLINKNLIRMKDFKEYNGTAGHWLIHYADFKLIEDIIKSEPTPVYQILELQNNTAKNIILTFNEELADKIKTAKEKINTEKDITYIKISFELQKRN